MAETLSALPGFISVLLLEIPSIFFLFYPRERAFISVALFIPILSWNSFWNSGISIVILPRFLPEFSPNYLRHFGRSICKNPSVLSTFSKHSVKTPEKSRIKIWESGNSGEILRESIAEMQGGTLVEILGGTLAKSWKTGPARNFRRNLEKIHRKKSRGSLKFWKKIMKIPWGILNEIPEWPPGEILREGNPEKQNL